jgi:hypothetical protein
VPERKLGRALSQNSVSGNKNQCRVKKWRVKDHHRNGRHRRDVRNREVLNKTIKTCMKSVETFGTRMKFIEAAMNDMKRLLKRIASTDEDSDVSSY